MLWWRAAGRAVATPTLAVVVRWCRWWPTMDSLFSFRLDDLVRDPSFNFLFKLCSAEEENDHNDDFHSSDMRDSPYSHSSFNTSYYDTL